MGGLYRRKKSQAKNKVNHRGLKTRKFTKFQDQVHDDIQPENEKKFTNMPVDEDLPGLGQYYCICCGKNPLAVRLGRGRTVPSCAPIATWRDESLRLVSEFHCSRIDK